VHWVSYADSDGGGWVWSDSLLDNGRPTNGIIRAVLQGGSLMAGEGDGSWAKGRARTVMRESGGPPGMDRGTGLFGAKGVSMRLAKGK
jgi:hypothetical protein